MDSIKIYSSDGALLIDAVLEDSSAQDWGIMSENQVSLDFYTDECIILPASCYIDYEGQRFWLLDEYKPTENNSAEWSYQVRFLGAESLLAVTVVLKQTDGSDEPIFNLTAPASQHLEFIVSNLNRRFPGMGWSVGSVPSTENIFIEYAGTYASEALQTIVGDKYEWWVDDFVINIGRCEFGERIELGYQNGLLGGITYSTANEMRSYAYLYPIGSTRNIDPSKYGYSRLQLPNGLTRIDINPEQGLAELVESDAFADIFPRYVGKVTAVRTSSGKNEDGTSFTIYHIKDSSIPFNPNNYEIAGEVKQITFQSGELMGAEFEVNYDADNKEFEIITQFQNGGLSQLPGGALIPKVGDKYVVWNISMPDEYYPLAEQEFLQAALAFASESVKEASVYRAPVDFIEVQQRGLRLRPGQRVRLLSNEYFPDKGYYDSRITRITRDVCYPDEITIEVSSVVSKGTISRLRNSVNDSATKVASLGQSLKNYVDITSAQSIFGAKNFVNGFTLAGVKMYRHVDGYVYLDETLVLKGGVVMYGNSSGVDVPSIFDSLPIDGLTIKRDGNGALYVDETALSISGGGSGGGGVADSVYWNNVIGKPSWIGSTKPTYEYSEIGNTPDLSVYAKTTDIPSLAGYATQTWVENKGYLLATTASNIYQPKITSSNKLAYSLISNTPDLSVYALNTDLAKKWTQNDAKIANWDSAYSWGNHANAGYAKASDVTNEFKNYVKLAGDSQSITAQHNFANGLKIGGVALRKVDNYLYLDSSLVLSGGVTMYGDDGTTVKPIWESIPLDESTLAWLDGKLSVIGGVGGGGISEEFLNVTLQGYQTKITSSNKLAYSLISGTPDLSVYALNTSIPTKLSQLTDDVVAGNYLPLSGGTINGSLTATSFIGNLTGNADSATTMSSFAAASDDTTKRYIWMSWTDNSGKPAYSDKLRFQASTNTLFSTNFAGNLTGTADNANSLGGESYLSFARYTAGNGYIGFYIPNTSIHNLGQGDGYIEYYDGVWYNAKWGKVTAVNGFIGNLTGTASGNLPLTGGTLSGELRFAGNLYQGAYTRIYRNATESVDYGTYIVNAWDSGSTRLTMNKLGLWYVDSSSTTHSVAFTDSNVASATKLATARTIWGQSFDGTGNITGDIAFEDNKKISWHNQPSNYYINSPVTNDGAYLQYVAFLGHRFLGGNVAIGGTTADENLHVHGNVKASLFKSAQGYTLTSSATTYCGLMPNNKITQTGNATDFWLYNTTDIKYYATKHIFLGDNVAIGDTRADAKLHVHGDAIIQTLHFTTNEINGVNGTGNAHINYSSTGKVTIANGGGNVAIGGTATEAKLHVHGTAKFEGDTTFSSKKIAIGTIPVYQSADGTLFVDANVVFRGGVAMYGDATTAINEE